MPNTRKLLVFSQQKRWAPSFLSPFIPWIGLLGSLVALVAVVTWSYSSFQKSPEFSHTIIATKQGMFGDVSVVRDTKHANSVLMLIYGRSIIGGHWEVPGKPSLFIAFEVMGLVLYAHPNPKNALVVGLGAGIFVNRANQRGVRCDVVEIDPVVVDFARQYFGFSTEGEIYTENIMSFVDLEKYANSKQYDIIVHDIFSGDVPTEHYTSLIFRKLEAMLKDDGIFLLNYIGIPNLSGSKYIYHTLNSIWSNVRCFTDLIQENSSDQSKLVNMVFFASHKSIHINKNEEQNYIFNNYQRTEIHFQQSEQRESYILANDNHEVLRWGAEEKRQYVESMLELFDEAAWKHILSQ